MKITNRGFSITEIDAHGVMAIDVLGVEGEEMISIVTGPSGENLSFSREGWRTFATAVAAVNERLDGKPADAGVPTWIIDGEGDRWKWIEGTDKYKYGDMIKTREDIKERFGIRG